MRIVFKRNRWKTGKQKVQAWAGKQWSVRQNENDFCRLRMADTASVMFCQQDFLRKNKKKRDAGYPVLAPDVLWLEILQTLRFYREGSLWHKRNCCV